jgi:hypothetical protein
MFQSLRVQVQLPLEQGENRYKESAVALDKTSLLLKFICTKLKHDNYVQSTQFTIKKVFLNGKLGCFGLKVECEY